MPTSNDKRVLKGQVTRLQKRLETLAEMHLGMTKQLEEAQVEAEQKAKLAHDRWNEIGRLKELLTAAQDDRSEAEARLRLAIEDRSRAEKDALRIKGQLQAAQAYAEGLLDGLHPRRPELPWERREVTGTVEFPEINMESLR